MKSQALLTVWCNISGGAGGEIWHWSLSGVKGLTWDSWIWPLQQSTWPYTPLWGMAGLPPSYGLHCKQAGGQPRFEWRHALFDAALPATQGDIWIQWGVRIYGMSDSCPYLPRQRLEHVSAFKIAIAHLLLFEGNELDYEETQALNTCNLK